MAIQPAEFGSWSAARTELMAEAKTGFKARVEAWQFPLQAAFARTVHSSQGSTVHVPLDVDPRNWLPDPRTGLFTDDSGNFAGARDTRAALVYVSLSRASALDNLKLLAAPLLQTLRARPDCLAYDDSVPAA